MPTNLLFVKCTFNSVIWPPTKEICTCTMLLYIKARTTHALCLISITQLTILTFDKERKMEAIIFLIAMVLLGVITMGGGTAVFCCIGWESSLPVIYTNKLMEELLYHEECTRQRFRSFAQLLTRVAMKVSKEAAELPTTLYLSNNSTAVDLDTSTNGNTGEVSCQTTADTTNHHNDSVVIDIEDPAEEWERAYDRSPTDADIWTRVRNFYSFRMSKDYNST